MYMQSICYKDLSDYLPCRQYDLFVNVCVQVEAWIAEKMQTASEESYRDMTNLQSKLQMHQAFEAELTANQERVETVQKVCKNCSNSST